MMSTYHRIGGNIGAVKTGDIILQTCKRVSCVYITRQHHHDDELKYYAHLSIAERMDMELGVGRKGIKVNAHRSWIYANDA